MADIIIGILVAIAGAIMISMALSPPDVSYGDDTPIGWRLIGLGCAVLCFGIAGHFIFGG